VPLATIVFEFDPLIRFAGRAVRIETLVHALVIFGILVVAVAIARSLRAGGQPDTAWTPSLRADDLLFIVLAIVPGAVVGGRLGYVLTHLDYYAANTAAIVDPAQGGFLLSAAVIGGTLTGVALARLLGGSTAAWLHVAAVPLLLGLGLGKVAMALGGSGQGLPSGAAWSTAYLGPGPWGSLAPALPSDPSQLYEAATTGIALVAVGLLFAVGAFGRRDALAFLVAVGLWAFGRWLVAFTWRDAEVLGPLRADQLVTMTIMATVVAALVLRRRSIRRSAAPAPPGLGGDLR
jgi:phosphatidylglycerol:prolipoprotein diacylglycerol transferase